MAFTYLTIINNNTFDILISKIKSETRKPSDKAFNIQSHGSNSSCHSLFVFYLKENFRERTSQTIIHELNELIQLNASPQNLEFIKYDWTKSVCWANDTARDLEFLRKTKRNPYIAKESPLNKFNGLGSLRWIQFDELKNIDYFTEHKFYPAEWTGDQTLQYKRGIKQLIVRCWDRSPANRPNADELFTTFYNWWKEKDKDSELYKQIQKSKNFPKINPRVFSPRHITSRMYSTACYTNYLFNTSTFSKHLSSDFSIQSINILNQNLLKSSSYFIINSDDSATTFAARVSILLTTSYIHPYS
ncbi:26052_t:CDS:2 [Dentiscutata erythropus]|uniref:26052_t:CDS:1 n=1 Tax=Dentiscutata erythropus TaxID=1348616 RepID=A0A9N9N5K8_9GLOM|nr:26052_t:CDS:2 [Dentiscutata erythropus]